MRLIQPRTCTAVTAAVVLIATATLHAYTPLAFLKNGVPDEQVGYIRWQQLLGSQPIPFAVSNLGTPDIEIPAADPAIDEFEAIELAFHTWEQAPGVGVRFDLSRTDTNAYGYDGQNVIFFADLGEVGYGAVTLITFDNVTGQILDADVHLNDHSIRWLTSLNAPDGEPLPCPCQGTDPSAVYTNDAQGMATHEIGHALGLDHSAVGYREFGATPTMFARGIWSVPGDGDRPPDSRYRTLEPDDVVGLQSIYPPAGWGQQTASLTGVVHDRYDAPLFGAHVVARSMTTGVEIAAMSGAVEGPYQPDVFMLAGLPPDVYQVRAEPIDGSPPSLMGRWNFGGIDRALVPAKFPATIELPVSYHKLVYQADQATPLTLAAGETGTAIFRPIAALRKLPRFLRLPAPLEIHGVLNADVTGPLDHAVFEYTVDGGTPLVTALPPAGGPFSVPIPRLPSGSLIEYSVEAHTLADETYRNPPMRIQTGLSGEPVVFVSKTGGWTISAVDTKTFYEIDETAGGTSYPLGLAYHQRHNAIYAASFGNDTISYIPLSDARLPPTQPRVFDSDGDGLLDVLEPLFATDPHNPDTDGDLSLDGREISEMFFTHPAAGNAWFEVLGGTTANDGTTPLGAPTVSIAVWNVTANGWATSALPLTPSGRFRLRLPVGATYNISYFHGPWLAGTANFTAPTVEAISIGITRINLPPPYPRPPDTGTNPLDPFDGRTGLFRGDSVQIALTSGADPYGLTLASDDQRYLYVAGSGSNAVYKIDTITNQLVGQSSVGSGPQGIAATPDGAKLFVAHSGQPSVAVLAAADLSPIATIPLPAAAHYVHLSRDGSTAVVTLDGTPDIAFIDTAANVLLGTASSGIGGLFFLSPAARTTGLMAAGTFQVGQHHVAIIDPVARTASAIDLGAAINATSGLAMHPDGQRGYGVHYLNPAILEFDLAAGTILRTLPFGFIDTRDLLAIEGLIALPGDINSDNNIDYADLLALLDILLGNASQPDQVRRADVNGDDAVDGRDIAALSSIFLSW